MLRLRHEHELALHVVEHLTIAQNPGGAAPKAKAERRARMGRMPLLVPPATAPQAGRPARGISATVSVPEYPRSTLSNTFLSTPEHPLNTVSTP